MNAAWIIRINGLVHIAESVAISMKCLFPADFADEHRPRSAKSAGSIFFLADIRRAETQKIQDEQTLGQL